MMIIGSYDQLMIMQANLGCQMLYSSTIFSSVDRFVPKNCQVSSIITQSAKIIPFMRERMSAWGSQIQFMFYYSSPLHFLSIFYILSYTY